MGETHLQFSRTQLPQQTSHLTIFQAQHRDDQACLKLSSICWMILTGYYWDWVGGGQPEGGCGDQGAQLPRGHLGGCEAELGTPVAMML